MKQEELGGWHHIPSSTLVVRGTLTGIVDEFSYSDLYDVWALEVSEFLIGDADTMTLKVGHYSSRNPPDTSHVRDGHDLDSRAPWAAGDEGIFFLTTWFHPLPELYLPVLGSIGIVTDDLDYWSQHIPQAAGAIGPWAWSDPLPDDDFARAVQTEYIVDGLVTEVSAPRHQLGSSYIEVTLTGVVEAWSDWADLDWLELTDEMGEPPPGPPDQIKVVFPVSDPALPDVGTTIRIMIGTEPVPEPEWHVWMAIGGSSGLLDMSVAPEALREEMARHRREENREVHRAERQAMVTAILVPLAAEFGRIPLRSDREPQPESVDLRPLMYSPLPVAFDGGTIIFSIWPSVMAGTGEVTILDSNGSVLLEGPFEGPDSIMRWVEATATYEFIGPNGQVVAAVTAEIVNQTQTEAARVYEEEQRANPTAEPWPDPVDLLPLFHSPLVVEQGGLRVEFDQWFFSTLQPFRVKVTAADGVVLTEGDGIGPDSIFRALEDGSIEIMDRTGAVVVTLTQTELYAAADAARIEYEKNQR